MTGLGFQRVWLRDVQRADRLRIGLAASAAVLAPLVAFVPIRWWSWGEAESFLGGQASAWAALMGIVLVALGLGLIHRGTAEAPSAGRALGHAVIGMTALLWALPSLTAFARLGRSRAWWRPGLVAQDPAHRLPVVTLSLVGLVLCGLVVAGMIVLLLAAADRLGVRRAGQVNKLVTSLVLVLSAGLVAMHVLGVWVLGDEVLAGLTLRGPNSTGLPYIGMLRQVFLAGWVGLGRLQVIEFAIAMVGAVTTGRVVGRLIVGAEVGGPHRVRNGLRPPGGFVRMQMVAVAMFALALVHSRDRMGIGISDLTDRGWWRGWPAKVGEVIQGNLAVGSGWVVMASAVVAVAGLCVLFVVQIVYREEDDPSLKRISGIAHSLPVGAGAVLLLATPVSNIVGSLVGDARGAYAYAFGTTSYSEFWKGFDVNPLAALDGLASSQTAVPLVLVALFGGLWLKADGRSMTAVLAPAVVCLAFAVVASVADRPEVLLTCSAALSLGLLLMSGMRELKTEEDLKVRDRGIRGANAVQVMGMLGYLYARTPDLHPAVLLSASVAASLLLFGGDFYGDGLDLGALQRALGTALVLASLLVVRAGSPQLVAASSRTSLVALSFIFLGLPAAYFEAYDRDVSSAGAVL